MDDSLAGSVRLTHDRVVQLVRVRAVQHRQQRVEARLKHGHHLAVQQVKFRLRQRRNRYLSSLTYALGSSTSFTALRHDSTSVTTWGESTASQEVDTACIRSEKSLRTSCDCGGRGLRPERQACPARGGSPARPRSSCQRAGLQQQVGSWTMGASSARLAAAERVIDSEADDVDEVSRVENRERLGEVRAHLGAFGALEEREAPHAVGDKADARRSSPSRKPLTGAGLRRHLHLLALLTEKVGHGPEQRLHADDEGLDQRLGVREALDGLRGGDLAAAVPDDRLVLVDVLLAVLLLTLGTLVIRRLRLVDFVSSSLAPLLPRPGLPLLGVAFLPVSFFSSSAALDASFTPESWAPRQSPAAASSSAGPRPALS